MIACNEKVALTDKKYALLTKSKIEAPTVSVAIPVFNMESKGFLDDLFSAISKQNADSVEYILVDDCSTDATLSCLIDFGQRRDDVTVIHSFKNGRQGAARNKAIEVAKGEYIGFLDADDTLDPGFFSLLCDTAKKESTDVVIGAYCKTSTDLQRESETYYPVPDQMAGDIDDGKLSYLILHPFHIWTGIYRRSLFPRGRAIFPEGVYYEDNPAALFLLCHASSISLTYNNYEESGGIPRYKYRQSVESTDHRVDIIETLIEDRMVTSRIMYNIAKGSKSFSELKSEFEAYYLQVALLNSLSKLASAWHGQKRLLDKIIGEVKEVVPEYSYLRTPPSLSHSKRTQLFSARMFPRAYFAILRILARSNQPSL